MRKGKLIIRIIGSLALSLGLLFLLLPALFQQRFVQTTRKLEQSFTEKEESMQTDALYEFLKAENERLYAEKQKDLKDPFSYEVPGIDLSAYGIEDNLIGFLTIPRINETLPLYLGANESNMTKGAVHLTQTSYPIGGINTNVVIAAHRGYYQANMFRQIDKLEIGDFVYIKNFRESLAYRVVETKIISPDAISEVLIRDQKDMITLLSCHPYMYNYKRYVVYCERDD